MKKCLQERNLSKKEKRGFNLGAGKSKTSNASRAGVGQFGGGMSGTNTTTSVKSSHPLTDEISTGGGGSKYNNDEMVDAIERFTSDQYENIRKASRGEKIMSVKFDLATKTRKQIDVTDRYKNMADAIEQYIAEDSKVTSTLYRGITVDDKTLATYKPGKVIEQQGVSSWSTRLSTAENFGAESGTKTNKVVFVEPKGTKKGRNVTDKSMASKMDKDEVLQSVKNKQKIDKVERKKNITYVYVTEK